MFVCVVHQEVCTKSTSSLSIFRSLLTLACENGSLAESFAHIMVTVGRRKAAILEVQSVTSGKHHSFISLILVSVVKENRKISVL